MLVACIGGNPIDTSLLACQPRILRDCHPQLLPPLFHFQWVLSCAQVFFAVLAVLIAGLAPFSARFLALLPAGGNVEQ